MDLHTVRRISGIGLLIVGATLSQWVGGHSASASSCDWQEFEDDISSQISDPVVANILEILADSIESSVGDCTAYESALNDFLNQLVTYQIAGDISHDEMLQVGTAFTDLINECDLCSRSSIIWWPSSDKECFPQDGSCETNTSYDCWSATTGGWMDRKDICSHKSK